MISQVSLTNLIVWFQKNRSSHFFREDQTPYKVWISEVVLQQTRLKFALKPLESFLETFPTLESLAHSSEEKVLKAFSGLGYYSRARNLLKGAKFIYHQHTGFPSTYEELLKVPSIGPYTAAAIASICFQEPIPTVDGNLKRILARTEEWPLPINSSKLYQNTWKKLKPLYQESSHHPGMLNEGLMELGQKICTPQNPKCDSCPIQSECGAYIHQKTHLYPQPKPKKEWTLLTWHAHLIFQKDQVLLQKWTDFYFLKGHWAFPSQLEFHNGKDKEEKRLFSCHPFPFAEKDRLKTKKHTITHHKIILQPILSQQLGPLPEEETFQWVPIQEISHYIYPSAIKKIWKAFQESQKGASPF